LGDLAEHIARGRTDQGVQAGPALPLLVGLFDFCRQRLVGLLAALIVGLLCAQFGALLLWLTSRPRSSVRACSKASAECPRSFVRRVVAGAAHVPAAARGLARWLFPRLQRWRSS
jgi:hypothetical protein